MRRLTQPQLPGRRPVESAEQVKERRLPAAARPPHGQGFTAGDLQVDVVNGTNEALAAAVVLAQPAGAQQHSAASPDRASPVLSLVADRFGKGCTQLVVAAR